MNTPANISRPFRVLRVSRDWQEIHLYQNPLINSESMHVWPDEVEEIELEVGGELTRFRRLARSSSVVTWQAPGWYVKGYRERPRGVPVASLQAQGVAWASSPELGRCVDELEGWLFDGATGHIRRPGRTDLCADVWFRNESDALEELEQLEQLGLEAFKTHARAVDRHQRKLSNGKGERTLYIGSRARLQLRIYRKDVAFSGSTFGAFQRLWRALGWDGSGAVLRIEFEIHRTWLREHKLGAHRLSQLPLERFEELLPDLWRECLTVCSHRPGTGRPGRRPESALWQALRAFDAGRFEGRAPSGAELSSCELELEEEALGDRFVRSVWSATEGLGDKLVDELLEGARSPPPRLEQEREQWAKRSRWTGHFKRKGMNDDRRRDREAEEPQELEALELGQTQLEIEGFKPREASQGSPLHGR